MYTLMISTPKQLALLVQVPSCTVGRWALTMNRTFSEGRGPYKINLIISRYRQRQRTLVGIAIRNGPRGLE